MNVINARTGWLVTALALAAGLGSTASAQPAAGFSDALMAAERPAAEKERDASRKPAEVLDFVGIGAGMTVLEAIAGGGWYTEVLSAAVGPEGKIYAQNAARMQERVGDAATARAARLGNVEVLYTESNDMGLPEQVDAAFTALNLHDMANRGGGAAFLEGIYAELRPGGVFGVIDHVGIAGRDNADLHRIEKATARDLLTEVGFVIEAESDILMNAADDHTLGAGDPSLQRTTDRMLFRARKPQ